MRHTSKLSFASNKKRNGVDLGPTFNMLRFPIHWTKQSLSWEDFGKAIIMDMQYLWTHVYHSILKMAYQGKNWHYSIKKKSTFKCVSDKPLVQKQQACALVETKNIKWQQQKQQVTTQQPWYFVWHCLFVMFTTCHICLILQFNVNHVGGWNCMGLIVCINPNNILKSYFKVPNNTMR